MIGPAITQLMLENQETFVIPAENVANVMYSNPLTHGLLVLSQVKYSKIPVLGPEDRFIGLLSMADIMDKMFEIGANDITDLAQFTIADVVQLGVPVVKSDWELEDVLHLLVDEAFLPVVDEKNVFKGIITRKEILKAVNYTFHNVDKEIS